MDKTFRLLLIAAIFVAISLGLSIYKKSKGIESSQETLVEAVATVNKVDVDNAEPAKKAAAEQAPANESVSSDVVKEAEHTKAISSLAATNHKKLAQVDVVASDGANDVSAEDQAVDQNESELVEQDESQAANQDEVVVEGDHQSDEQHDSADVGNNIEAKASLKPMHEEE